MKWILAGLTILLAVLLWQTGLLQQLSDINWVRSQVESAGAWGPILFLLLAFVLFPLFLAGPLIWLSAAIWSLHEAIFLANLAALLPSLGFYLLARRLGRRWSEQHVSEKIWRYERRLSAYPVTTIFMLRLFLWINPAVDIFIGISRIPARIYVIVSALALSLSTSLQIFVIAMGVDLFL